MSVIGSAVSISLGSGPSLPDRGALGMVVSMDAPRHDVRTQLKLSAKLQCDVLVD